MAESGAKVVIRGDASQFIETAKKVKKEIDEAGQKVTGVAKFGDQMANSLAKSVAKAVLLKAALAGAATEANKLRRLDAESSKTTGKMTLQRELAGAQLGFTGAETGDLLRGASARSAEELTGFFTGLADKSRDPGLNAKLDPNTVARAVALYKSGLLTEGEVIDGIKDGDIDGLERTARSRLSMLSGFGREEIAAQTIENRFASDERHARAIRGMDPRLSMAAAAAREARNPVSAGVLNAVGNATSILGGDEIVNMHKNRTDGAVLGELRMQTDELRRQADRPRLGGPAE